MKILGAIRFDWRDVIAARKGQITQLRRPAKQYDAATNGSKLTVLGRAEVGDLLWVGEPRGWWRGKGQNAPFEAILFCADYDTSIVPKPWPNIHASYKLLPAHRMPRFCSRLTLEITSHRTEPLSEITDADAESCGARMEMSLGRPFYKMIGLGLGTGISPREAFLDQWQRVRQDVDRNPLVAVVTFRVIEANVDALVKQEAAA